MSMDSMFVHKMWDDDELKKLQLMKGEQHCGQCCSLLNYPNPNLKAKGNCND